MTFPKGESGMISSEKRSKISEIAPLIIAVIALCLSVLCLIMTQKTAADDMTDIQYVIFLGTNDKDTNKPVFSIDEAKTKVEDILLERFGGYTIQVANGGWKDGGTIYREDTLVIYLSDTTPDKVYAAADEMLQIFNQKSVLIQSSKTKTEFYYSAR